MPRGKKPKLTDSKAIEMLQHSMSFPLPETLKEYGIAMGAYFRYRKKFGPTLGMISQSADNRYNKNKKINIALSFKPTFKTTSELKDDCSRLFRKAIEQSEQKGDYCRWMSLHTQLKIINRL